LQQSWRSVGRHQKRYYGVIAAGSVEIEQIECVVIDLDSIGRGKSVSTDFEFKNQDGPVGKDHRINTATEPQQRVFEQHPPIPRKAGQGRP
jgi:hypothetical protein